ncbi:amino acid transporter AVT1I-like isoform X1 [Syzygium oleosum]|uniref:amino acid transporter AVT1I-like isoform X1 n=1 Tax=Syzygium oleosum TaxID=219896 RepID=UPI0011D2B9E0|nr:amino acid transporter AVT1I-like isoform X1 [Syzygium oleosum]
METQQHEGSSPPQAKGTTFLRTCFNGINTLSGVGILSIPFALSQGGWLSLMFLFLVAILFWYTGLLLQRCMIANQLIKTYPDIGELAFGHKGRALISIFMYLELYLVAVEFLILEGDNLDKLFPNHGFKLGHLTIGGKQGFVLLATLVVLPTTWLRSLGALAYISAGGILASIILVLCVLWVGAIDGVGFDEEGTLLNWSGIPTAISLFAFCYGGHAVFPTLSNSMKDRSQFSKVLLVCFLTCTVTYGSMAVLGYTMYGEHLKSQVTLNLPVRKMSSKIAIYTTLINPLTKYALIINPIATALEETCPLRNSRPVSILLRTVIVVSTVIMALVIPFFGYVMAFIGSFLSVTMSVLLPCFCYLKINRGSKKKKSRIEVGVIVGIILVGFFIGVVGTYVSLKQIIDHLRK